MSKFEGSARISKKEGDTSINLSLGKKGFFERLREDQEKRTKELGFPCINCGRFIKKPFSICSKEEVRWTPTHPMILKQYRYLCKDCSKKCKECGKYFCPIHLKDHKCL